VKGTDCCAPCIFPAKKKWLVLVDKEKSMSNVEDVRGWIPRLGSRKPELVEIGKYDVGRVKTFYDVLQTNKIVGRKTIIVAEKK
jgi:hypothetical protein